ncbi:MAG: helicase-exonuclease AddAB subunit AddA [Candidatus Howiella sp.]|jgi:ATP-dependent helicase/nuclease subunit A
MPFQPTEEQALAICAEGTVLVSAAAGSGKTAVLTSRVLRKLLEGADPVPADRLLVVTFTNAAAAEMRGRIEKLLADALAADPGNPRILRQTLLLQNANISTIDAFCLDLVRENFDRLGISPDFKIASAEATAQFSDRVLEDIFAGEFAARSPEFTALLSALGGDFGEERVAAAVRKLYEFSASTPFPKAWRHTAVSGYAAGGSLCETPLATLLFDHIAAEGEALAAALHAVVSSFGEDDRLSGYRAALLAGEEQAAALARLARTREWDALRAAAGGFAFPRTLLKTGEDPFLEQAKATYAAVTKSAKARVGKIAKLLPTSLERQTALMAAARPAAEKLVALCDRFEEGLFAAHNERNLLTFADAEHLALSLFVTLGEDGVLSPAPGAEELCARFDEVLVDEYQDTNPLQDTLFYAVSDGGRKLFMVGDVKQSIYRFRHADPDGFLEKKERFSLYPAGDGGPAKIILGRNFRSRAGICHYVNFCFSALMNEATCGMAYAAEDRLIPAAVYPETPEPEAELLFLDCEGDASRIEGEASAVARYIHDAVEGGLLLRDREDPTRLRPAGYGDFAILLRSFAGKADVYAAGLKAMGIPVSVSAGSLLSSPEVMTFLSILKVISNPTRDLPLLSALTCPVFGFSFEEVAALRADAPEGSLYTALAAAGRSGNERARAVLSRLEEYRYQAAARPVDRFLLDLLEETGYLHLVLAMENGAERQANLLLLVDMASQFSKGERMTLAQFLARIERADKADTIKAAPPSAAGEDAVKIMSIHSSKGLQFPVCILANCAGKLNKTDLSQSLLIDERLGIGLSLQDDAAKVRYSTLAREAIGVSAARASVAEELRLLYVAMTRAEEKLLMVVSGKSKTSMEGLVRTGLQEGEDGPALLPSAVLSAGSYADWLILTAALHPASAGMFGQTGFRVPEGDKPFLRLRFEAAVSPDETPDAAQLDIPAQTADVEIYAALSARFSYRYPYAALGRLVAKTGVSRLAEAAAGDDTYAFTDRPAFLDHSGLTAAERGTATHKFMQFADYAEAAADLDREIARLVALRFLSEDEAGGLYKDSLRRFFASDLYAEMQASPRLMREVRFIDELPAGRFDPDLPDEVRNEPVIVQGIADCIYEIDGGLVILDYKTDRVEEVSELRERYAVQLEVYAAAAEKTFGLPVRRCVIYSFYKNRNIIL